MKETRSSVWKADVQQLLRHRPVFSSYRSQSPYRMGVSEKYSSEWTQAQRSFFLFFCEPIIFQIQDNKIEKYTFFPLGSNSAFQSKCNMGH